MSHLTGAIKMARVPAPYINPTPIAAKKIKLPEPKPLKRNGKPITIREVTTNECRWLHGHAKIDTPMCGHPTKGASSYCEHHSARCKSTEQP